MKTYEIKELFLHADKQIVIKEEKKQQIYETMMLELEKQRIPVIKLRDILLSQFLYMDKSFLFIYSVLICFGVGIMLFLKQVGVDKNEIIISCMIGATILGAFTIMLIDKLLFGKMAELGASCYFSTKQCVATYMIISGIINIVIMMLSIIYVGSYWGIGILQIGVYILTPFIISNVVALKVLSTETGRNNPYFLFVSCIFLSIGYIMFSDTPVIFYSIWLGMWVTVCIVMGVLFVIQIRKLFIQMQRGEVLCMN